jgi:hypothetical protein
MVIGDLPQLPEARGNSRQQRRKEERCNAGATGRSRLSGDALGGREGPG